MEEIQPLEPTSSSGTEEIQSPEPTSSSNMEKSQMIEFQPPGTTGELTFQRGKLYHVFLSFRGPDVRKTMVDHLFEALSAAGLNVFKDDERLELGEKISPILVEAINSSAICIPIFSRGYADSAWCLMEAAEMLSDTDRVIIPLFYHVDPGDVRSPLKESSPYRQAFLKHYDHSDGCPIEVTLWWRRALQKIWRLIFGHSTWRTIAEINKWRNALHDICGHSGWSMDLTKGYEAQLVKRVVKDVTKTLDRMPLEVAKYPVGMDRLKKPLIQKLNLTSEAGVVKVGIWGIGGIGKTAVATTLYNQLYARFDAYSFVVNVRARAAEHRGLETLQKQILKELINYNEDVHDVRHGKQVLVDRLIGKRVLLILDDVDTCNQLEALCGNCDLGPGSRLIITSRDKHILESAGISSECIQEMSGLKENEAFNLFSWHAFHRESPNPDHEDLFQEISRACQGHPLSLVVTGSYLFDKDNKDFWTEALAYVTLNQDVHKILKISYNPLNEVEKEIFVDIACFFIGENQELPILFWKSLYGSVASAVHNLSMKSLIKIDDKGLFCMHDLLKDMGRAIAENDKRGTRLWEAARSRISSDNIKLSRLLLNGGKRQRLDLLFKSRELRYLDLQNLPIQDVSEDTLAMLPGTLIWLRLEHCDFSIEMNGAENRERHFCLEDSQLKIVQLKGCSFVNTLFISSLFSLPNIQLEYLDLGGCKSLNKIPHTIGNLSQLQHLDLRCCERLISLPNTIGNLSKLRRLNLEGCSSLNDLPETIGKLSELQHLNLERCSSLNDLPETIGKLSELQHLYLERCSSLNDLPETIGKLSELQHLNLKECSRLCNLPRTVGNLSQLRDLDLEGCMNLGNLPDTISDLSKLQRLNLRRCGSLKNLPNTIDNLSELQCLLLRDCTIKELPPTIYKLSQLKFSF